MVDASIEDWRACVESAQHDWKLFRALENLLGQRHSLSPLNVRCSEDDLVAMNQVEFRSEGDAVLVWASSFKQALDVVIEVSELFRELGQQVAAIPCGLEHDKFTEEQAALVIAWVFRLCDLLEDVTLEEFDEVIPETVTVTGDLNAVADFGKVRSGCP